MCPYFGEIVDGIFNASHENYFLGSDGTEDLFVLEPDYVEYDVLKFCPVSIALSTLVCLEGSFGVNFKDLRAFMSTV